MTSTIVDRGDGPKVAGTRITVYAILEHLLAGRDRASIADFFRIPPSDVEAAEHYIEEHRDEVMTAFNKIMERIARGNPPEIEAKFAQSHRKLLELRERLRSKNANGHGSLNEGAVGRQ